MTITPLYYREYGNADAPPLLLLHGLFGSSANWHGIARRLADRHWIIVPDLRNHGRSPWSAQMSYETMAGDIATLMGDLGIPRASIAGHSMGGKAAMWMALTRPDRINRLVVADIAPVGYQSGFSEILAGLNSLPLHRLKTRAQADSLLVARVPERAVRNYLLQNLIRNGNTWRWRLNLPGIGTNIDSIMDFPTVEGRRYPAPTQFVYGTASDYVGGDHLATIRSLFPLARLRAIPNAGHWVYADQPDAFIAAVSGFLKSRSTDNG